MDMVERAEALISRIVGISSCKITTDETGEVLEIHVVATAKKPAKLIARDVEGCLIAEMGIRVDHRKIGVVLLDSGENRTEAVDEFERERPPRDEDIEILPIEEQGARFVFRSVNLFISDTSIKAEVELTRSEQEAFGSAETDRRSATHWHVVAEATLKAVSELLDESVSLCLCDVLQVPLGDKKVMLVRVDMIQARERKSLAGCSIVSSDETQTVVYATLDAVNRVVGKLKPKGSIEYKIQ
ncbi:MAG: hypothetical protein GTO42_02495 [Candidatus Latescibacteria bacterium]|nr:hypothetical protein [Candidatus Latescibacterota bacterium]NIO01006.1 hypothetical protein [Candidatus Latescibacterota bacterium]NIO27405.1 hypothetical protein [Candidatus Latescibacterota bacterium]NIO54927.1 hypothetical protein [Candidatus Latescibacterota bacterium]NIT01016.1 hypothetical protein [Candidatus Latescibacterota bacterium]